MIGILQNESFTVRELARMARRDPKTITRWIRRGWIQARDVAGRYQIDEPEVRRMLKLADGQELPNVAGDKDPAYSVLRRALDG